MLVGYGRVSTQDQSTDLQTDALTAAGCKRLFIETKSSGAKDRPQLAAALDYVQEGDTIVVWRLARLAQSLHQLIETVADLDKRGISLKSLNDSIDTSAPGGRLVFHIFESIDEFERALIREKTNAGLVAARKRGRHPGRPPLLDGERLEIAQGLLDTGTSVSSVARSMGVSRSTVLRATRMAKEPQETTQKALSSYRTTTPPGE